MNLPADQAVMDLERDFPMWQVWVVHRVIGGPVWCARLWNDHKVVLNAYSAGELREYLEGYVPALVETDGSADHT